MTDEAICLVTVALPQLGLPDERAYAGVLDELAHYVAAGVAGAGAGGAAAAFEGKARLDKALKLKDTRDRLASLTAGALVRAALDQFADRAPAPLTYGTFGKPDFRSGSNLHFSLAHTRTAVCCAVSVRPVGVDVEGPIPFYGEIAERCFNDRELRFIEGAPTLAARARKASFVWTRKEALGKYCGRGLANEVLATDVLGPNLDPSAGAWWTIPAFTTFQRGDQTISVCGHGPIDARYLQLAELIAFLARCDCVYQEGLRVPE